MNVFDVDPEKVADRLLQKWGRRSAWTAAKSIAEEFDHDEDLSNHWNKVAEIIKRRLKNEAIP